MSLWKRLTLGLAAFLAAFSFMVLPATVYAAPSPSEKAICEGLNATGTKDCKASGPSVESVVKTAIQLLSLVAGIAAVIMIIVAGIRYITSGGDAGGVKGAKEAIIYAIVGIIVVALSQAIVVFVLDKTNSNAFIERPTFARTIHNI